MIIHTDFSGTLGEKAMAWVAVAQTKMWFAFGFSFDNGAQSRCQILVGLLGSRKGVTVVNDQKCVNGSTIFTGINARVDDVERLAIQGAGNLLEQTGAVRTINQDFAALRLVGAYCY